MECSIFDPMLRKHLVIGQRRKAPNFSAFYWSPHDSLVSIGQYFVFIYRKIPKQVKSPNRNRTMLCEPCIATIAVLMLFMTSRINPKFNVFIDFTLNFYKNC